MTSKNDFATHSSGVLSMSQSRTSLMGGNSTAGDEDSDDLKERRKAHPYDTVFGKRVNSSILKNDHAIAKISLYEFEDIKWPNEFPSIICDIIEYLTELSIVNMVTVRNTKHQDDRWKKKFTEEVRLEREKDPSSKVTEKDLIDKYRRDNKTKEDIELEDLIVQIGETGFSKLWRFFVALSKNGQHETQKTQVYLTQDSIAKNFSAYYGHKTDFMDKRFYMVLTGGKTLRRIYINDFIKKFYFPLYGNETTIKLKNKFALDLLDLDLDGNLSTKDLVNLEEMIET